MKKQILLLTWFCISSTILLAQIQQKTFLLESNFHFNNEELRAGINSDPSMQNVGERIKTDFSTSLGLRYFIFDKTMVGLSYQYAFGQIKPKPIKPAQTNPSSGFTSTTGRSNTRTRTISNNIGIHVSRLISITQKLYFIPRFSFWHKHSVKTYSSPNLVDFSTYEIVRDSVTYNPFGVIQGTNTSTDNNTSEKSVTKPASSSVNIELSATLFYQINNWLGVQMKFISSDFYFNYKNDFFPNYLIPQTPKTEFDFDFTPRSWEFGFIFIL